MASSTNVFQAWHAGHCPSQRGALCPHCWQTKAVRRRLSTDVDVLVDNGSPRGHSPFVPDLDATLADGLRDLDAATLRRRLRPIDGASAPEVRVGARHLLLLSSNNYLGLATHPALADAARAAIARYGCSAGSSRLIAGDLDLHEAVEAKIAAWKGTAAALLFPTGYHANVGTIGALVGAGDHVFSDALNHASIIDGCRLSRAAVHVYPHRDVQALEGLLATTPPRGRRLIVTDSVFSMDGDRAPLDDLVALAERYHTWLMIDEAHAGGVFGAHGAGLADACGLTPRIHVHMGTLGKALGGMGAYVAGSRELIDWIVNRARTFIFTTGLAPAAVAAAGAAVDLVATDASLGTALHERAAQLRRGLGRLGFDVAGDTHILPLMVGDNARAMALAEALLAHDVLVHAIRPPTVPPGTARLRVTPMATHTPAQMERALDAFAGAGRATGVIP